MDRDRLYELTMKAIGRAMDGDSEGATDAMMEIGQTGTWRDVYGACCAYAEVGKAALIKFYGDKAPNAARGDMWAMDILDPTRADPAEVFATRFIIAYANDDKDNAFALFRAALESDADQYVSSVAALLATAVSLAHSALRHARAQE